MRVFFPVFLLVAVLLLLVTSLATALVALLIPLILVIGGAATIVGLRSIRLGLELMRGGMQLLSQAFGFFFDVVRLIFLAPDVELELTDSVFPPLVARLSSPQFPEFHRLQQSVAAELGLEPAAELWISPDSALGITTARREGKRIKCLVVGLELVRTLTPEQLRAALFHEFGHDRGGDLWVGRWARHLLHRLLFAAHHFSWLNPARWSAELSLWLVRLGYLPWSRAQEYAADRCASRYAGPRVLAETLRTVRREGPAIELSLSLVLQKVAEERRLPVRLGESVQRMVAQISPEDRHRLGLAAEGDPLDLGGRTHPSIALRIAALAEHPPAAAASVPQFDATRLAQLDERLTSMWLSGQGRTVSVDEFFSDAPPPPATPPPAPPPSRGLDPALFEPPAQDDAPIELDYHGDWRKRRG